MFTVIAFQFETVTKAYGEDPASSEPDEFFGIFDTFLTSFAEAKRENERIKKQREEEAKRARLEEQVNFLITFCLLVCRPVETVCCLICGCFFFGSYIFIRVV